MKKTRTTFTAEELEELRRFDALVEMEEAPLSENREIDRWLDDFAAMDHLCHQERRKRRYQRQYREANKEKVAEYQRQYREANKEKLAEYQRRYREANKEKLAKQRKEKRIKSAAPDDSASQGGGGNDRGFHL